MILVVHLASEIVDSGVTFDVGGSGAIFHHDRWAVKVDAVVDNEQRVIVVNDIVVNTDTIEILL